MDVDTTHHLRIRKVLVANRGEIAIRIFRAANELGIATIGVFAEEDKLSLHRFKADEAYLIGRGAGGELKLGAVEAYLSIEEMIRIATEVKADAIHPGYGFLSESPEFADACAASGIRFIGPSSDTMRMLGNKIAARNLAISVGVPVMPATSPLPDDAAAIKRAALEIGYPVMLKASWGGGGRGMRPLFNEGQLLEGVHVAKREAKAAFGKDEVYLEKLVQRARHVEVQILGDQYGTCLHLFERDCTVQRRNQKIIERAPAAYLSEAERSNLCEAALKIAKASHYVGAGTVEFLVDVDTHEYYFIEVNPRIQVEHTVTEQVTGLDIVKAQIKIQEGGRLGSVLETGIPGQSDIKLNGHALQCRITTENPENNFIPDYGRISAYRGAFGFGIRVDGGTAYSGAVVNRYYDPMLEKVTAWASSPTEVIARMSRAVREYRIRGVATNLNFLESVLNHPKFASNDYTTRFIDETPELFRNRKRRDRATRLLTYIADVTVNGHPETRNRARPPAEAKRPRIPSILTADGADSRRETLEALGPRRFAQWMRDSKAVLITDTTMRDAHQSLLATRMRTFDISAIASTYSKGLGNLLSLECWGGATFDVAMRFLTEDPWDRLAAIRAAAPNLLTQMLLRGANGVGYTNYPDNVVKYFIDHAARGGIDIFRIFDCFNWVENMRVAIDAVCANDKIAEGTICYTGDILDPNRAKYSLQYYVSIAKELQSAGCHVLGVKDMAGVLKPAAAKVLVKALRDEVGLPVHLHTHDTSGVSAATLLAAVDAGVDAIDAAIDSMSGTTSQPCLGSIVEALRFTDRDPQLNPIAIREISSYWEQVRVQYTAFETEQKSGASEVYLHEMPGGQFTNLKEQARSIGLGPRWNEVAKAYHDANDAFGDIIKVTPSSKVVGDMALMMVAQNLTPEDLLDPKCDIAFPASVVEMLRGDLGQPKGGWPPALQARVLKGAPQSIARPGLLLPSADLIAKRSVAEAECERPLSDAEFASYLMYPKVFKEFLAANKKYGPVSKLPTLIFFYGMQSGDEAMVQIESGKTLVIRLQAIGETDDEGNVKVFFELNGQPRTITVPQRSAVPRSSRVKADAANPSHVGAPMQGLISSISVRLGQVVAAGDGLFALESMKMETIIHATTGGRVKSIEVECGQLVETTDLLAVIVSEN